MIVLRSGCCYNFQKCQNTIDAQATKIASMKEVINWALEENKYLNEMFNQDQLVNMISKAESNLQVKGKP